MRTNIITTEERAELETKISNKVTLIKSLEDKISVLSHDIGIAGRLIKEHDDRKAAEKAMDKLGIKSSVRVVARMVLGRCVEVSRLRNSKRTRRSFQKLGQFLHDGTIPRYLMSSEWTANHGVIGWCELIMGADSADKGEQIRRHVVLERKWLTTEAAE